MTKRAELIRAIVVYEQLAEAVDSGKRDRDLTPRPIDCLPVIELLNRESRPSPRFDNVSCSHCGQSFGPGDHGFSHCDLHKHLTARVA